MDEILDLIKSVSEGFPTYSHTYNVNIKSYSELRKIIPKYINANLPLYLNIIGTESLLEQGLLASEIYDGLMYQLLMNK